MTADMPRNNARDLTREAEPPRAGIADGVTEHETLLPGHGCEASASGEAEALPTLHKSASVGLTSLAPSFERDQHGTYLRRLNAAVKDNRNRNIALTGRYGSGKSSVLDEFERSTDAATLRLAISSLGPNEGGVSLTNRIQKEIVKQLVYSAAPSTLRHSRFTRSVALSWRRAAVEAIVFVLVAGALLAMLGWLPPVVGTGPEHHTVVQVLSWLLLAALFVVMATVVRLVTHDRFHVAEVSAGGATISLSKPDHTYFDEYLDDIVNYFDNEDVDIVIFEDLDRFDDPHIFEALREMNTLLNKTKKRQIGRPLRFIYAVRDSLFELIGNDITTRPSDAPRSETDGDPQVSDKPAADRRVTNEAADLATAEAIRANRTKFFDLVIPMVPFISYRNARELLVDLLADAGICGVERPLVSIIARFATDMRLLLNIRNEYLVFAERLLESQTVAPGLTSSNLFALVAYKNFHLADFEDIARQASVLNRLYDYRRELVRSNIERLEREKRALASDRKREAVRAPLATQLSQRLLAASRVATAPSSRYPNLSHLTWRVDREQFTVDDLSSYPFWTAVANASSVEVRAAQRANSAGQLVHTFSQQDLAWLVPEAFEAGRWADSDARLAKSQLARIDQSIRFLRGSNFRTLAGASDFKLPVMRTSDGSIQLPPADDAPTSDPRGQSEELNFRQLVVATIPSRLGRELVLRGYLDQNFALYAAQFYGHFTGIDVANFIVQNVQTNTMEVDYQFDGPDSVENLLNEADDDFVHTVAAYNIDVLNYLLDKGDPRALTVVHQVADNPGSQDAKTFLTAFLTSNDARREQFVAHLAARPWRDVFTHLAESPDVPEDARPSLFSAALRSAKEPRQYDLSTAVGDYIAKHYLEMATFTHPSAGGSSAAVAILAEAGVQLATIRALHGEILDLVVVGRHYALNAENLHAAVGDPQDTRDVLDAAEHTHGSAETKDPEVAGEAELSLDRLRHHENVYRFILDSPDEYLAAVDDDSKTPTTVRTATTLMAVLTDVDAADAWGEEHVRGLIDRSFPTSRLDDLTTVPSSTWEALAAADRFRATLRNVEAYRAEVGVIDEHLGRLLEAAGEIDADDGPDSTDVDGNTLDRVAATYAILNSPAIADIADKVKLAVSVGATKPLPVTMINVGSGDLLALLLREGLIEDDAEAFRHFRSAGWSAIGPGIAESSNFADFVTPELVEGMVADVLRDRRARSKVGQHIVKDLATFVPDSDAEALRETGRYARAEGLALTVETIHRVAAAADNEDDRRLVLELLRDASPRASAENVAMVFQALGNPYNYVTQPGATFELAKNDLHEELLKRLDGRVEFRKRTRLEIYKVTVL